ncbi:MAG: aminoacyl-tRNA hydrolase [Omnitrophica WOR_2 bacterium RIFCSPLOWO2_12_FULL_46_30]|nr:MAG: aminoacyl-tRNA hydrolase [Omnitrophica WOR_2 bacterium RIFCSPLOWO2_02_FULL_45_28]OGX51849.1 MAG: aminoacyl-tRNA hydrolase [Omnitrophica WOR_2 bacterium RIFCSPLOWO2_12_FULL_46_30]
MKLVIGLGNPGPAYKNTRHNLGFMVIDALSKDFAVRLKSETKTNTLKANTDFRGKALVLCKPLSYMNLSGSAVLKLLRENGARPQDILVICDDVNLELGRLKLKAGGSAGGHNGLVSLIASLKTEAFPRMRIGIAAPEVKGKLSDYVLSRFSRGEQTVIRRAIEQAKKAVLCWLENGINLAMDRINPGSGGAD